jgi:ligand-binding sensor domain-containing protein
LLLKRLFTFLILLISTSAVFSQNKKLRGYTIEDGLPQSQVYDVIQDERGYLWLGTQGGGLSRFNGSTFDVWNESDGLLSNYIFALLALNEKLYIGTKNGLSIKTKATFLNREAPQVNKIYHFNNTIYLATKRGIYRLTNAETLTKVTINPEIDSSSINAIVFKNDFFWIATNQGFYKLKDLKTALKSFKKLESNNFSAALSYQNKIYASTFDDGTFVFDLEDLEEPILLREPLRINSLSIQNETELWVATDNDGILIIDTKTNNEKAFLNAKNGLNVAHIRKVIADKQGNIWIATSGGGLYKYFQNNFKHYSVNSGLKGNRVYAVHQAKDGLYFSSSEAGLSRMDSAGIHHIKPYKHFADVKIKTITSDANGNIWAGSDGRGLLFRETKTVDSLSADSTEVFKTQTIKNHLLNTDTGFPNDWIRKIKVDKQAVYAATYSSGIIKFNYYSEKDSLVIRKTYGINEGIEDLYIKDMIARDHQLWYATKNGQIGYIENSKVHHLGAVLNNQTTINSLVFNNKTLFIGTAGQGIWFNRTNDYTNFEKLKGDKTLTSKNIYQLIFDNQGNLWAGSERGVDKILLNQENTILDVFHFGRNDGFLGIETCLNAVEKDANGNLWFGTIYGLTKFQPSESNQKSRKPNLFFQEVKIDYKSVDSINLKTWTNSNKTLQLNPNQRQVSFQYASVDLDHPNDIQFRTKLNDTEWSPWTGDTTQNLSGLAFGAHTFFVQSRNYRWEESDPISFGFYIESPLYKKAGFQWLVILATISLLSILALRYIKRVKKENAAETERLELANHLLTLEQKALRLQMNPHFIFNVLNGIKAMATTKPEKMNTTINSFATLLRNTLMNSRKDTISLAQEIKTLQDYIEVEKLMATKDFNYEIKVHSDLDPEEIVVPPMLIQPFVENAIRHGILKGKRDGMLKIVFNTTKDQLHCSISDNGVGIYESQKNKPKTDHQSMALTVTEERLESISGKNALKIEEIVNQEGSISGTNITFNIPLETDY